MGAMTRYHKAPIVMEVTAADEIRTQHRTAKKKPSSRGELEGRGPTGVDGGGRSGRDKFSCRRSNSPFRWRVRLFVVAGAENCDDGFRRRSIDCIGNGVAVAGHGVEGGGRFWAAASMSSWSPA